MLILSTDTNRLIILDFSKLVGGDKPRKQY